MSNILVLGPMADLQTGMYIVDSAEKLGHNVEFIDTRALSIKHGSQQSQKVILHDVDNIDFKPDVILILKGLELAPETIKAIKLLYKDAKLVNWFFDVYLMDKPIYETEVYFDTIKLFDYYFCSLKGVATKLRDLGFENVYWLKEACSSQFNGEQLINSFQKKKYGSDVSFIGSIGYHVQHSNRIKILSTIIKAGFDIKIWGNIIGDNKNIPLDIRHNMVGTSVINESHSMVCQSTLINLGIDQQPEIDNSMSARIYRIMCAGGLYLSTATKGIEDLFIINKKGEKVNKDQDLVVFYDDIDLIKKIDFLLEHDDIRESIARNGQKKVKDEHTFKHRISEMLEVIQK